MKWDSQDFYKTDTALVLDLFTQRCIMDFKLLFEDFPERIIPYDYDSYFSNPDRFVMVTTNCLTGKQEGYDIAETLITTLQTHIK